MLGQYQYIADNLQLIYIGLGIVAFIIFVFSVAVGASIIGINSHLKDLVDLEYKRDLVNSEYKKLEYKKYNEKDGQNPDSDKSGSNQPLSL